MSDFNHQVYEDIGAIKQYMEADQQRQEDVKATLQQLNSRVGAIENKLATWRAVAVSASSIVGFLSACVAFFFKWLFFRSN